MKHGKARAFPLPLALAAMLFAPAARAATLTPSIATDELASPGAGCSLREAVLQANRNVVVDAACGPAGDAGATDTITLAPGETYRLTIAGSEDLGDQGDLDVIDNPAAEDLVIEGNGATIASASAPKDRVVHVLAGASVTVRGVTIRDGSVEGPAGVGSGIGGHAEGGGILSLGTLSLADCAVIGNRVVGGTGGSGNRGGQANGGGIVAHGPLSLTDCRVEANVARGGSGGSGGSGVGASGGGAYGGGMMLHSGGETIEGSTFAGNRAEGGEGGAGLSGTGCGGNGQGGGIHKLTSLLTVSNSTLSGNAVVQGPGEGEDCGANLGGGFFVTMGGVTFDSVTLTGSIGGGIFSDGQMTLTNSIVALQSSGPDCLELSGSPLAFVSNDYNLDSDGTCRLSAPHDQAGVSAFALGLGPLADNGGPTPTHAITPGRAAWNRGSTALPTDQRGVLRPQQGGTDVGAFEATRDLLAIDVPALSPWGLLVFFGLLGGAAVATLRRRRRWS